MVVQVSSSKESESSVGEPEQERWEQKALELHPMSPAGANVDHGENIMGLAEELVSCCADSPRGAADKHEKQQYHGHDTPDDVCLDNPLQGNCRLRLVEADLDDAPTDGVKGALDEDKVA